MRIYCIWYTISSYLCLHCTYAGFGILHCPGTVPVLVQVVVKGRVPPDRMAPLALALQLVPLALTLALVLDLGPSF